MTEISIDLTDGEEESVLIYIRLIDPSLGDGVDVWSVQHGERVEYFECEEDDEMIDVIAAAIESLQQ
jgi:hypothetical protein